jgi:hypothetical protein
MEIKFEKLNNAYVAEFEVTADFNLHIERNEPGILTLYQRTTTSGDYAEIEGTREYRYKEVYDYDFVGAIYPKYIKVVSGVEVINAELTLKA